MTDIADLIRDSYEVPGPHPCPTPALLGDGLPGRFSRLLLFPVWMHKGFCE